MTQLVPFRDPFLHLDRVFDTFFTSTPIERSNFPKINITHNEDRVTLEAAIAGFTKDEINVEIEDNTVTISGKSDRKPDGTLVFNEIKTSQFSRSITMPDFVDVSSVTDAVFEDGILTLGFNLSKPISNKKQIEIK